MNLEGSDRQAVLRALARDVRRLRESLTDPAAYDDSNRWHGLLREMSEVEGVRRRLERDPFALLAEHMNQALRSMARNTAASLGVGERIADLLRGDES